MTTEHLPDDGQLIRPDIGMLHPSPTNPRKVFAAGPLQELAESIRAQGIMQPILARTMPADMARQLGTLAQLEIVAGERRWRAAGLAGLPDVPVLLRKLTDEQVIRLQIVENLQREGLSPIEEAEGYGVLQAQGLGAQQIAAEIGKSKAYVYAKLKLLALCDTAREALRAGDISESVALLIARIPVHGLQREALGEVSERDDYTGEAMSYREAKKHIADLYTIKLTKAPFDLADADLLPEAGSCLDCPHRLGNQPDTEPQHADVCTLARCYHDKAGAHQRHLVQVAEEAGRTVIGGEQAKQIRPTQWASCGNGFVGLDERCYEAAGYPTYRDLLDRAVLPPATTLLDDPHGRGLMEIVNKAERATALADAGITITRPPATDIAAERTQQETAWKLENTFRQRLFDEVRSQPVLMLTTPDLMLLAEQAVTRLYEEHRHRVAQLWHPDKAKKAALDQLLADIPGMSDADLTLLLRDTMLIGDARKAFPQLDDGGPQRLLAAARRIGIDPERIRAEVVNPPKPKPAKESGAAVRYRHPDNPAIGWSGKGRKPQWVVDWLAGGRTIDEIEVQPA